MRASVRPRDGVRDLPGLAAPAAANLGMAGPDHRSSPDLNRFARDKCLCNLSPAMLQNAAKGRPRDIHLGSSFFLRIAKEICQPDGFEFVGCQLEGRDRSQGNTCGLECDRLGEAGNITLFEGSGHFHYEHMLIINIQKTPAAVKSGGGGWTSAMLLAGTSPGCPAPHPCVRCIPSSSA